MKPERVGRHQDTSMPPKRSLSVPFQSTPPVDCPSVATRLGISSDQALLIKRGGGLLALRPPQPKRILTQNLAEGKSSLNQPAFVGPPFCLGFTVTLLFRSETATSIPRQGLVCCNDSARGGKCKALWCSCAVAVLSGNGGKTGQTPAPYT